MVRRTPRISCGRRATATHRAARLLHALVRRLLRSGNRLSSSARVAQGREDAKNAHNDHQLRACMSPGYYRAKNTEGLPVAGHMPVQSGRDLKAREETRVKR